MSETLKEVLCCGKPAIIEEAEHNGEFGFGVICQDKCGNGIFSVSKDIAIKQFLTHPNSTDKRPKSPTTKKETTKPVNNNRQLSVTATNMREIFLAKENELKMVTSPVLLGDKPAMDRFLQNNTVRYPLKLKGPAWDKIWVTEEGQQSIIKGIEDSLIDCVELGVTGDLVPMGNTCILIPSVESFEFRLTHGNNAPFENITIECIYADDQYKSGRKNGNFFLDFESFGKDRKKVILVAVYGELKKTGIVVGEMYDAERLLEKAALHSKPYANYIKIMKAYEYQKSEGRTKIDPNGREFFSYFTVKDTATDKYFQKSVDNFYAQEAAGTLKKDSRGEYSVESIPKKTGGTFEKKLYRSEIEGGKEEKIIFIDELENPYSGADQPEMLRKAAGKSFLGKYAKVRNSEAAMEEVRSSKGAMKQSADYADGQFDDDIIEG